MMQLETYLWGDPRKNRVTRKKEAVLFIAKKPPSSQHCLEN